jgi:hypothetical protein
VILLQAYLQRPIPRASADKRLSQTGARQHGTVQACAKDMLKNYPALQLSVGFFTRFCYCCNKEIFVRRQQRH